MSFSDFLEHLNHFSRFMLKDSRVNENLLAERLLWTGMCFFFGRPRRPCVLCVLTLGYQPGSDVLRKGFLYVGRPVEDWTIEGITPVYVHEAWIKLFLFSEFVPACVFIKKKTRTSQSDMACVWRWEKTGDRAGTHADVHRKSAQTVNWVQDWTVDPEAVSQVVMLPPSPTRRRVTDTAVLYFIAPGALCVPE